MSGYGKQAEWAADCAERAATRGDWSEAAKAHLEARTLHRAAADLEYRTGGDPRLHDEAEGDHYNAFLTFVGDPDPVEWSNLTARATAASQHANGGTGHAIDEGGRATEYASAYADNREGARALRGPLAHLNAAREHEVAARTGHRAQRQLAREASMKAQLAQPDEKATYAADWAFTLVEDSLHRKSRAHREAAAAHRTAATTPQAKDREGRPRVARPGDPSACGAGCCWGGPAAEDGICPNCQNGLTLAPCPRCGAVWGGCCGVKAEDAIAELVEAVDEILAYPGVEKLLPHEGRPLRAAFEKIEELQRQGKERDMSTEVVDWISDVHDLDLRDLATTIENAQGRLVSVIESSALGLALVVHDEPASEETLDKALTKAVERGWY